MKVAGVILAAGASSRLGQAKQLVELGGERLLERAVRVAREAGLAPVVAVLGCGAQEIRAVCPLSGVKVVLNESWAEGMGSSVRTGVAALGAELDGMVLMTCDQPAVTPEHLSRLAERGLGGSRSQASSARVGRPAVFAVGSAYAGRIGVPAFFPASRFGELLGLRGDEGARKFLGSADAVELPGGELDVDTAEALAAARQRFR